MTIKLVCFDLDGTINDGWALLQPLKDELVFLRNSGVKLAIITGREAMATLFFVHRSGFPFDYIGCGGGPVIKDPLSRVSVTDLFEDISTFGVMSPGLGKTDRALYVTKVCGVTQDEMLFIDDNANRSLDVRDIESKTTCLLGCPATNNLEWVDIVRKRSGLLSDKPCGLGTLDILMRVFVR